MPIAALPIEPRDIAASWDAKYAACLLSYATSACQPPAASISGRNHISETNANAATHAIRCRNVRICHTAISSIGTIGTTSCGRQPIAADDQMPSINADLSVFCVSASNASARNAIEAPSDSAIVP